MNSCGVNIPEIFNKYFSSIEEAQSTIEEYYFSEWYSAIEPFTIKSYIFDWNDLLNGNVDELIKILPNKKCFARLDTCSSKPTFPFYNSREIINHLTSSDRTREYCNTNMKIIIREWTNIDGEFRCYFCERKLRAINGTTELSDNLLTFVNNIRYYSEYDDCCIDFGYTHDDKLIVIEINTPVYLCGTSGNFDLMVPYDREILLGKYNPNVINYPVMR